MSIPQVSCCDRTDLYYDPTVLVEVWRSLVNGANSSATLMKKGTFLHDIADIGTQVLSNLALDLHTQAVSAFNTANLSALESLSEQFLSVVSDVDSLAATQNQRIIGAYFMRCSSSPTTFAVLTNEARL